MEKEYIVNYKIENAAQWDGMEPHEEMTENSEPIEAESREEAIDLYADYIEEQARENGYEAERFVDTNGQTVVKTEKDGEAQYYILTGAKGEPMECYGGSDDVGRGRRSLGAVRDRRGSPRRG